MCISLSLYIYIYIYIYMCISLSLSLVTIITTVIRNLSNDKERRTPESSTRAHEELANCCAALCLSSL